MKVETCHNRLSERLKNRYGVDLKVKVKTKKLLEEIPREHLYDIL